MIKEACYKITENCPCNCSFCDSKEKYEKILKKKIMPYEDWKNISDKLITDGLEVVVVSGGEALLNEETTIKLINYLKGKGIYVVLNTSGIVFNNNKLFEKVKRNYPSLLVFSVDSAYQEQHDNNRRMDGVFKKVVESIKELKKINSTYPVGIRTVITKDNYEQLPKIISDFNKLGVDCIKLTNIENDVNGNFRLSLEDYIKFDEKIRPKIIDTFNSCNFLNQDLKNEAIHKINNLFLRDNGTSYNELSLGHFSPDLVDNASCDLNGHFFTIQSNGDVLPCCEAEHHYYPKLGNIKKQEIEEIRLSNEYKKFINRRLEYCITCTQRHNLQINFTERGTKVNRR